MKSSMVTRGFGAFSFLTLATAAVLVFHSAAYAQQAKTDKAKADAKEPDKVKADAKEPDKAKPEEAPAAVEAKPAPAPEDLPPEYGPPPGYRRNAPPPAYGYPPQQRYGYPPHGYGQSYDDYYYGQQPAYPPPRYYRPRPYQPAPVRYYPEPIAYRTFFFGLGLGIGGVALFPEAGQGENASNTGMAYNLHFGFGVSPRWSIVLSGDGAFAYFSGYNIDQSVWSIGPQVFINRHLYARGGIGVSTKSVSYDTSYDYYDYTDSGMGWVLALGWEFMQSYHASLGLEAAATYGRYKTADPVTGSRDQGTIGINFMLKLF